MPKLPSNFDAILYNVAVTVLGVALALDSFRVWRSGDQVAIGLNMLCLTIYVIGTRPLKRLMIVNKQAFSDGLADKHAARLGENNLSHKWRQ